jgi:ABC-2 type transport system ATP-binding protein
LWQTIREIRDGGTTVVLTTHYMEEAEVLCDRVAVMDHGDVIACDTPAALIRNLGKAATVHARVLNGALPTDTLETLPAVTGVNVVEGNTDQPPDIELHTTNVQSTLVGLLDLATRQQITLGDLRSTQASLEDVFLSLTGRAYEGENAATEEDEEGGKAGRRGGAKKRRWRR